MAYPLFLCVTPSSPPGMWSRTNAQDALNSWPCLHLPTAHGSHLLETLKLPTTKSKLISPTPSLLPSQTFALVSPPLHSGYISAVVLRQSPLVQIKLA